MSPRGRKIPWPTALSNILRDPALSRLSSAVNIGHTVVFGQVLSFVL